MSLKPAPMKSEERDAKGDATLPLVARVLAGDHRAFEEIVHLHEAYVLRTCLAITRNPQDAMQDTFINAYRGLSSFRGESAFRTWLTRIALNEALKRLRKYREIESLDEMFETEDGPLPRQLEAWHPNPEQLYHKEEIRRILEEAIGKLPAPYRVVFVLRDICGLNTLEAAEALNLSVPAMKSRLLRGRLMVRESLARYFGMSRTWKSPVHQFGGVLHALAERFCRAVGLRR